MPRWLPLAGLEKQDILELAQRKVGAWEVRRLLACSAAASAPGANRHAIHAAAFRNVATQAGLTTTYKELMLKVHPDKSNGDTSATPAFQYLQQAYGELRSTLPT